MTYRRYLLSEDGFPSFPPVPGWWLSPALETAAPPAVTELWSRLLEEVEAAYGCEDRLAAVPLSEGSGFRVQGSGQALEGSESSTEGLPPTAEGPTFQPSNLPTFQPTPEPSTFQPGPAPTPGPVPESLTPSPIPEYLNTRIPEYRSPAPEFVVDADGFAVAPAVFLELAPEEDDAEEDTPRVEVVPTSPVASLPPPDDTPVVRVVATE